MKITTNTEKLQKYCCTMALSVVCVLLPIQLMAQELSLLLDWTPNTNHSGIYVAKEMGWYGDMDLSIIIPGDSDVHKLVAAGQADVAVGFQEGITLARTEGIPVVSIAAIIQHNTSAFAGRKGQGIQSPADFVGKRYGGFGSPLERPMIDALMQCSGKSGDDVTYIDIGWADFLAVTGSKRIDFSWIFYGWTGIDAELKGVELETVTLTDYDKCIPDFYTPVLMTSENTLQQKTALLRQFIQATAKGYAYAISKPKHTAEILLKHNPELPQELVIASQQWLADKYQADAKQWGWQEESVWRDFAQFMIDHDIITTFDSKAAFSNQLLPE